MIIYTDGASSPKSHHGAGGWGWARSDKTAENSGNTLNTTNQRMEMYAAYDAMLNHPGVDVEIVSDSQYVVKCFNDGWYRKWQKNGWKNGKKEPVANQDLWEEMLSARALCASVKFTWVRGHDGNEMNEYVDKLAVNAKKQIIKEQG